MKGEPLDSERVHELSFKLLEPLRDNYVQGPESRDRSLEALNALASVAALVIMGCDGLNGEAQEFFVSALSGNLINLAREHESKRTDRAPGELGPGTGGVG
jgi:hypothetical protein